ncbi:MAG: hypothetical protein M5U17_16325 [Ignavibacterium sp.]|nr:hypothetical protein [Ignavibacterium sp.]
MGKSNLYNTLEIPGSFLVRRSACCSSGKLSEQGFMGLNDYRDLIKNNSVNLVIIKIIVQTFNWLVNNGLALRLSKGEL